MTSPTILEPREFAVLDRTPLYDASCGCGLHTVTLIEPQICNRCGSLLLTVFRVQPKCTDQETYDTRA